MNFDECIEFGKPTPREKSLMIYIGECLAQSIEKHNYDREEMLCALNAICSLMFTAQTPIKDIEEQCAEIDCFCECLKLQASHK